MSSPRISGNQRNLFLTSKKAYSDANGNILPSFYDALGIYCWAWFILTVIYTVAAVRSSWPLFLTLFFLDIVLVLLAAGYMVKNNSVVTAGYSIGFIVTFLSCEYGPCPYSTAPC